MPNNYFDNIDLFVDSRVPPSQRLNTQKAFEDVNNETAEGAAKLILAQMEGFDTQDPASFDRLDQTKLKVLKDGIREVRSGDAVDVLGIMFGAAVGGVMGSFSHKVWDMSPRDIPVNGLIGAVVLGGASIVLLKDAALGIRGAVGAAGAAFLAGSTMWVQMNPEVASTVYLTGPTVRKKGR